MICKSPKFTHCPYSGYHAIYTSAYSSIDWQLTDGNMALAFMDYLLLTFQQLSQEAQTVSLLLG